MGKTLSTLMTLLVVLLLTGGCTSTNVTVNPPGNATATGRAVFVITDAAANMGTVSSVAVTVDSVQVHSASEGWVTVSSTPRTYDLLQLKAGNDMALLADVDLKEGAYEQARLDISSVIVTDAKGTHEAKLPSNELEIVGRLEVDANTTSTAKFDFIADESLHVTGKGEYVMAPVVQMETRQDADVEINSNSDVEVTGGVVTTNTKVGMDISGNVGVGLGIKANQNLDIEGGKIKIAVVMPEVNLAGTGRAVVGITDAAGNFSSVTSVKITVDSVSVHSQANGWATISSTPKTYDLLELRGSDATAFAGEANLKVGTYEQLRMVVTKVEVTDANGTHEAKLPSGELKIAGKLYVKENMTSTATFDFIVDESIHMTGSGDYILAPVVRLETRENAMADVNVAGRLEISGGTIRTNIKVGMDDDGNVGVGLRLGKKASAGVGVSVSSGY